MMRRRMQAIAPLVILLALVHSHLTLAQVQRTAKHAAEDDIRESVIRYQMKDANSEISFIKIDGKDPTDDFMTRLRDIPRTVKKASSSAFDKQSMSVVDKETGEPGTIYQTGRIRWLSRDSVTVEGGFYCGATCAGGLVFRLRRKYGKWVVTGSKMGWIS